MALAKAINTDIGVDATYWRIVRIDIDLIEGKVWFVLNGYTSQEAREAGKNHVLQRPYTMDIPEDMSIENLTRGVLYEFVKTSDEEFTEATLA